MLHCYIVHHVSKLVLQLLGTLNNHIYHNWFTCSDFNIFIKLTMVLFWMHNHYQQSRRWVFLCCTSCS
jgi:hypothetical protein